MSKGVVIGVVAAVLAALGSATASVPVDPRTLLVCPCERCGCPEPERWPGPIRCARRCWCRNWHVPFPGEPEHNTWRDRFRRPGDKEERLIGPDTVFLPAGE